MGELIEEKRAEPIIRYEIQRLVPEGHNCNDGCPPPGEWDHKKTLMGYTEDEAIARLEEMRKEFWRTKYRLVRRIEVKATRVEVVA